MKRILSFFILAIIMISPVNTVSAHLQHFVGNGYVIRDSNIPFEEQKDEVIKKAKQDIVSKAGYYIRTYSKVDKNILTDDNVYIVSSEIADISGIDVQEEIDINGVAVLHAVINAVVDNNQLNKIKEKDIQNILLKYNGLNDGYKLLKSEYVFIQSQLNMYNHYIDGVNFQREQNYSEAIICYRKALLEEPNFKEAHIGLGFTYLSCKKYTEAISEFEIALSKDKRSVAAHYGKAKTYAEIQNYRDALIEYNIVLTLNDKYIPGYEGRSYVYHCMNKLEQEHNDYEIVNRLKKKA